MYLRGTNVWAMLFKRFCKKKWAWTEHGHYLPLESRKLNEQQLTNENVLFPPLEVEKTLRKELQRHCFKVFCTLHWNHELVHMLWVKVQNPGTRHKQNGLIQVYMKKSNQEVKTEPHPDTSMLFVWVLSPFNWMYNCAVNELFPSIWSSNRNGLTAGDRHYYFRINLHYDVTEFNCFI